MMKPSRSTSRRSVKEASQILAHHGPEAGVYAGGTDCSCGSRTGSCVAEISGRHQAARQAPLHPRDAEGGSPSGPSPRLRKSSRIRPGGAQISAAVETLKRISSPELRNQSTIGGDIMQEVWCQYLRGEYSCWRNGGYICYGAIGDNSYYHCVMGGRLCYAVYPGDAAIGLIPFDARVKLATPAGIKEFSVEQLVPGDMMVDGRIQSHVVRYNEILTEVVIPPPKAGTQRVLRKTSSARRLGFRHGLAGDDAAGSARHRRCARRLWRNFRQAASKPPSKIS